MLIIRAFRFSLAARGEIIYSAKVGLAGTFHQVSSAGQSSPSGIRGSDAIFRPLSADSVVLLDLPLLSAEQSQTRKQTLGLALGSENAGREYGEFTFLHADTGSSKPDGDANILPRPRCSAECYSMRAEHT